MRNLGNGLINWKSGLAVACACGLVSCAEKVDPARPTAAAPKSMTERLSESGGYKQDEDGAWVPRSDKRSAYDSQRESAYFTGKIDKKTYKTGEYAKKSWWGTKEYESKAYAGNTDGSRFQTQARQQGQVARFDGNKAREGGGIFQTNTMDRQSAREAGASEISRPENSRVEARRQVYKAPSVVDWREQRELSIDKSRSLLGR
jgi:hypothetical protein